MLLWHGHQWGQGASCWQDSVKERCQAERAAGWGPQGASLAGPRWWLGHQGGEGGFCGPLMWPLSSSRLPSVPSAHSVVVTLRVPLSWQYPHPSPHMHTCAYTAAPGPAVSTSPGSALFLMSGQSPWGLLTLTWFWVPGEEMEQMRRSQGNPIKKSDGLPCKTARASGPWGQEEDISRQRWG